MNPSVPTMVAGVPATRWRRFAAVAIVQLAAATHLRLHIDPRLLPAQCRLFRRMVVAVGVAEAEAEAEGVEVVEVVEVSMVEGDVKSL